MHLYWVRQIFCLDIVCTDGSFVSWDRYGAAGGLCRHGHIQSCVAEAAWVDRARDLSGGPAAVKQRAFELSAQRLIIFAFMALLWVWGHLRFPFSEH